MNLQGRLTKALDRRLSGRASPLYQIKQKTWDMQSGPPICALRARGHRISDKGRIGRPTAKNTDGTKSIRTLEGAMKEPERKGANDLAVAAVLTGWPTPKMQDGTKGVSYPEAAMNELNRKNGNPNVLSGAVFLVGWPTPMAGTPAQNGNAAAGNNDYSRKVEAVSGWLTPTVNDFKNGATPPRIDRPRGMMLEEQVLLAPGPTSSTSPVSTEKPARYRLNPAFSRWLMGFPRTWDVAALIAFRRTSEWKKALRKPSRRHIAGPRKAA